MKTLETNFLPHFRYFDIVRDVRQNKGSILKASVEYIKKLKVDQDRKKYLEEKSRLQEYQNKKLLLKLQVVGLFCWNRKFSPSQIYFLAFNVKHYVNIFYFVKTNFNGASALFWRLKKQKATTDCDARSSQYLTNKYSLWN